MEHSFTACNPFWQKIENWDYGKDVTVLLSEVTHTISLQKAA